jgi:ABC-2 type transport system permease protein
VNQERWPSAIYRVRCLLRKELLQIRRDRRLFGMLLITPLFQLLVLGHAATTDIRNIDLAVRDRDRSDQSRAFVRAVGASGYFRVSRLQGEESRDGDALVTGHAGLVMVIPRGFGIRLDSREAVTVQVLIDGADSNFAVHGLNYLQKAARLFNQRLQQHARLDPAQRRPLPSVRMETRAWYNADLTSRFYMVPAIMGVLLLVITTIVTSMSLVREREIGTMEQLIVTPLRPWEVIVGKLLPFVFIGFVEVTLALPIMLLVFGVPLHGSVVLLYAVSGIFLLTTLGLGLFVSTLVRTQQQAMLVAGFFIAMPFILLSGFIFPVENMPRPFQLLAALIPLKYYLTMVRGIFLKGSGLALLWPDAAVLLLWGFGILALASLRFRKRLD